MTGGAEPDRPFAPLMGTRVLELGQYIAGPATSLILANLGAEVIKVEPVDGEPMRPLSPLTFDVLNRDKRSIAIDLKRPEGVALYLRLAETADVVIDNLLPGTLRRLGAGSEAVVARNPRVVYCGVHGFLPGPAGDRPMFDTAAQMRSGLGYLTGPVGQPIGAGVPIIDLGSAVWGALAILAGLLERRASGAGQRLEVGLFEAATYLTAPQIAEASTTGVSPEPAPQKTAGGASPAGINRLFETSDGRMILVMVVTDRQWELFCRELGLDELWNDLGLRALPGRIARSAELQASIARVVATRTSSEMLAHLQRCESPHAQVNTPLDVLSDEHLAGSDGLIDATCTGDGRQYRVPRLPFRKPGALPLPGFPAPRSGDATRALLLELGLDDAEIGRLTRAGVVRAAG